MDLKAYIEKGVIMQYIRRFISVLLCTCLTLSTPLVSLAGSLSADHNAQGNNINSVITGKGGDFSANISNDYTSGKLGLRFSLVDYNDPTKIISVDDAGNPQVVDVLYVTAEQFAKQTLGIELLNGGINTGFYRSELKDWYTYTSVKTQDTLTNRAQADATNPGIKRVYYDQINSVSKWKMEPWLKHNGAYYATGDKFVEWCERDDDGNKKLTGGDVFTMNVFGIEVPVTQYTEEDGSSTDYSGPWSSKKAIDYLDEDEKEDINLLIDFADKYKYNLDLEIEQSGFFTDPSYSLDESRYETMMYVAEETLNCATMIRVIGDILISQSSNGKINTEHVERLSTVLGLPYSTLMGILEGSGYGSMTLTDLVLKQYEVTYPDAVYFIKQGITQLLKDSAQKNGDNRSVSPDYMATAGPAGTTTYTKVDSEKDMTGTGEHTKDAHLRNILSTKIKDGGGNEHWLIQTESMRKDPKKELNLAKAEEDWVLLIEPVVWLTIYEDGHDTIPVHTKIYGTISNIAEAFVTDPDLIKYANQKTFNWKALNIPVWGALTVDLRSFAFKKNGEDGKGLVLESTTYHGAKASASGGFVGSDEMKLGTYKTFAELAEKNHTTVRDAFIGELDEHGTDYGDNNFELYLPKPVHQEAKVGYGVNVWTKKSLGMKPTGIDTWDKETYPDGTPGPAPDPTNLEEEPEFGEQNKKFKITKWYVTRFTNPNGTEQEVVTDVFTREDTPHTVHILNEGKTENERIYEVEKWATGKDAIVPDDGDTSTNFEEYYNSNKGKYRGTQPKTLTLEPKDEDKVLYVKLVAKDVIRLDGDLTIVKIKDRLDEEPIVEVTKTDIPENKKYPALEPGYTYVEDIQTPNEAVDVKFWQEVPTGGTHGTTPEITVSDTTKTIYIHYKGVPPTPTPGTKVPIVLHQNELAYPYTLRSLIADGELAGLQENFEPRDYTMKLCGGHSRSHRQD